MRVKEELLINILKGLSVGDDPVKVPSWCRPHDVKQYWDRLHRDEELVMTEDDNGNIFVKVVDIYDPTFWQRYLIGVLVLCLIFALLMI